MIKGATFEYQNVTSKIDGGFYNRIFESDGIVRGCSMSATAATLTIQPGLMIVAGRLIWIDGATQITFENPVSNGYGAAVLTIDLSQPATAANFEQLSVSVAYSATPAFPELTKGDINGEGGDAVYQAQLAIVSLSGGNIANIVSTIGPAKMNADELGGKNKAYYESLAAGAEAMMSAKGKGLSNDANAISDGWHVCNQNIPSGPAPYRFVLQATYSADNIAQIALPYSGGETPVNCPLAWRFKNDSRGWGLWQEDLTAYDYAKPSLKGASNDANELNDGISVCNKNIPSGSPYRYVYQLSYNANEKVQFALPFASQNTVSYPLAWRWRNGGGWSPWQTDLLTSQVMQGTGTSTENPMSQNAVTAELAKKINVTDMLQIGSKGLGNNADDIPDGITACSLNIPSGTPYRFVLQATYSGSDKAQLALPYTGNTARPECPLAWRYKNGGGWSAWNSSAAVNPQTAATPFLSAYRTSALTVSGGGPSAVINNNQYENTGGFSIEQESGFIGVPESGIYLIEWGMQTVALSGGRWDAILQKGGTGEELQRATINPIAFGSSGGITQNVSCAVSCAARLNAGESFGTAVIGPEGGSATLMSVSDGTMHGYSRVKVTKIGN